MVVSEETRSIVHGEPKQVSAKEIEQELRGLSREMAERHALSLALTLVIYTEQGPTEDLNELVGKIVERNPARVIAICADRKAASGLDAYVLTHTSGAGEDQLLLCEQVTLHARGDSLKQLQNLVLGLRARELPMVLWWRGEPPVDDRLFADLTRASDQIVLDSSAFSVPSEHLARLLRRMRPLFESVPLGDINWARLAPWRELVAQFFDTPAGQDYLTRLDAIEIEYSTSEGGNPGQALLLLLWMATQLNWRVVTGSWKREDGDRSLQLRAGDRQIEIEVRVNRDPDQAGCGLLKIALYVHEEPSAAFVIHCSDNDCATIQVDLDGQRVIDRTVMLSIPDEVSLVCYELDSARRDRVYHRTLEVLDQLIPE